MVHHHLSLFFLSRPTTSEPLRGGRRRKPHILYRGREKMDLRRGFDQLPNVVFDVTFNQTFQSPIAVSLISHVLGYRRETSWQCVRREDAPIDPLYYNTTSEIVTGEFLPWAASGRVRETSWHPVRSCPARVRAIPVPTPCPIARPWTCPVIGRNCAASS